jgi:hypothetical protein
LRLVLSWRLRRGGTLDAYGEDGVAGPDLVTVVEVGNSYSTAVAVGMVEAPDVD